MVRGDEEMKGSASMYRRRRGLWYAAAVAAVAHLALFLFIRYERREAEPEPVLSSRFVKRRPLRQRVLQRSVTTPRPVRSLKRAVQAPQAYARAVEPSVPAPTVAAVVVSSAVVSSVRARPAAVLGHGVPSRSRLRSPPVSVAVQDAGRLDMGLELLDVDALDTGRYRGLVVQDPDDKRKLKGFVRLAAVGIGTALHEAAERDPDDRARYADAGGLSVSDWRHAANVRALQGLALALAEDTPLRAVVDEDALLDSPDWLTTPFILLTATQEFTPTESELVNLGEYLASGGFAYVEVVGKKSRTAQASYGETGDLHSLRRMLGEALATQDLLEGRDWSLEPLAMDHPMYHCYFDVGGVPDSYWAAVRTMYANGYFGYGDTPGDVFDMESMPDYLEGIHLEGQLVAVYSQRNYRDFWSQRIEKSLLESSGISREAFNQWIGTRYSSDRGLRLGINIVVYALTQEGSLARRYVASP
jgi:uncharacterized protein DUF4159